MRQARKGSQCNDVSLPSATVGSGAHPLSKLLGKEAKQVPQSDPAQKG